MVAASVRERGPSSATAASKSGMCTLLLPERTSRGRQPRGAILVMFLHKVKRLLNLKQVAIENFARGRRAESACDDLYAGKPKVRTHGVWPNDRPAASLRCWWFTGAIVLRCYERRGPAGFLSAVNGA